MAQSIVRTENGPPGPSGRRHHFFAHCSHERFKADHLLVDTLGLVLGATVTPANTTEREGAQRLLGRVLARKFHHFF